MRNKWKDWVAFQALEQRYGTFTAIAMMEDASKVPSFIPNPEEDWGSIVLWVECRYRRLWEDA